MRREEWYVQYLLRDLLPRAHGHSGGRGWSWRVAEVPRGHVRLGEARRPRKQRARTGSAVDVSFGHGYHRTVPAGESAVYPSGSGEAISSDQQVLERGIMGQPGKEIIAND